MTALKFVFVMPLYGRPELTALILRQWDQQIHRLRGQVDLHLICIGSEGAKSSALVSGYSSTMSYCEAPNAPLNRKWNKGVALAQHLDPDAVLIVGSDDLISDSLLLAYADKLRSGLDFFGLRDLYFFDAPSLRLGHWPGYGPLGQMRRQGEPIGLARCHSRRVLQKVGWQLWPHDPERNTVLDLMSLGHLADHGFRPTAFTLAELQAKAVDIKIGLSMTAFDRIPYQTTVVGAAALGYLADLVDDAGLVELRTRWRAAA